MKTIPVSGRIKDYDSIRRFLLGGKASFTIQDKLNKVHVQLRLDTHWHNDKLYVLKGLYGPLQYHWLGTVFVKQDGFIGFKLGKTAKASLEETRIKYFLALLRRINAAHLSKTDATTEWIPKHIEFLHEGSCGVCGRPLTHPESIHTGIGPICSGRMENTTSKQASKR